MTKSNVGRKKWNNFINETQINDKIIRKIN
jgi:hypothetical protein